MTLQLKKADTSKPTGVKAKAWKRNGDNYEYVGNIDLARLKPGMWVKEAYGEELYREVVGELMEDDIDYMIPIDDNEIVSPLCVE